MYQVQASRSNECWRYIQKKRNIFFSGEKEEEKERKEKKDKKHFEKEKKGEKTVAKLW